MSDRFPGRQAPVRYATGGGPAAPRPARDRLTRIEAFRAATASSRASGAIRPPAPPRHAIIPEQTGAGYRCGVCLLAIIPAWEGGPRWAHAAAAGGLT